MKIVFDYLKHLGSTIFRIKKEKIKRKMVIDVQRIGCNK